MTGGAALVRAGITPQVAALLAFAVYPDPARVRATLERYASDPALQVWVWMQDGAPVCAAGLRVRARQAELLHLGTRPDARGHGHARRVLLGLMAGLDLTRLEAETDDGAVGFYRRCGFEVVAAPGESAARYRCTLDR